MKKYIPYIALAIVLIYFLTRKPERDVLTVSIPIPVVSHTFDTITQFKEVWKPYKEVDTVYLDNYIFQPVKVKDSLYKEAITIREYNQVFEDSIQKINVFSKVRGWLTEQSLSYETKPREVTKDIDLKSKIHAYFGGSVGVPFEDGVNYDPVFRANLLFQNKKGNILEVSYGTDKYIFIGYFPKIF